MIRPFDPKRDMAAVLEILERDYRNEFKFPLEQFNIAEVVTDAQDIPRIVIGTRPTLEAYALVDKSAWETPGMKFDLFKQAHAVVISEVKKAGYSDGYMFTPGRGWAKRLKKFLGWDEARPSKWAALRRIL